MSKCCESNSKYGYDDRTTCMYIVNVWANMLTMFDGQISQELLTFCIKIIYYWFMIIVFLTWFIYDSKRWDKSQLFDELVAAYIVVIYT